MDWKPGQIICKYLQSFVVSDQSYLDIIKLEKGSAEIQSFAMLFFFNAEIVV